MQKRVNGPAQSESQLLECLKDCLVVMTTFESSTGTERVFDCRRKLEETVARHGYSSRHQFDMVLAKATPPIVRAMRSILDAYERLHSIPEPVNPLFKREYERLFDYMNGESWFVFMNHGYLPEAVEQWMPTLGQDDDRWRHQVFMYLHLAERAKSLGERSIDGFSLLDVGCGRGGGLSALKRLCRLGRSVGLDQSPQHVAFCETRHSGVGLEFIAASATALPFDRNSFDLVSNVESSHCYPDMNKFFAEVRRVLKPLGLLLLTDNRDGWFGTRMLDRQVLNSGMKVLQRVDITPQVEAACSLDQTRLKDSFRPIATGGREHLPAMIARVKFDVYRSGHTRYVVYVMRKEGLM